MKIIVCVKQVPDTSGKVAVNPDGTLNRASMAAITNPDGIIVIPLKDAPEVLQAAKKFHEQDASKVEAAKNGTSNRAWVAKTIQAKNVEILDQVYGE